MLDKKGNSNTTERIELLKDFYQVFPDAQVAYLTADREFLGHDWFEYLLNQALLPFRIRIRESDKLEDGRQSLKAKVLFAFAALSASGSASSPKTVGALGVCSSSATGRPVFLIVVTAEHPHSAITDYAKRWSIETLFGCLKTRGFCLESTHLKDPERLSRLIPLLTIALCWAFRMGEWLAAQKPITIKKHGRKAKSIFRYGFDHLRRTLLNLEQYVDEFLHLLTFLSCT